MIYFNRNFKFLASLPTPFHLTLCCVDSYMDGVFVVVVVVLQKTIMCFWRWSDNLTGFDLKMCNRGLGVPGWPSVLQLLGQ